MGLLVEIFNAYQGEPTSRLETSLGVKPVRMFFKCWAIAGDRQLRVFPAMLEVVMNLGSATVACVRLSRAYVHDLHN